MHYVIKGIGAPVSEKGESPIIVHRPQGSEGSEAFISSMS